jgi:hypothetical protein
MKTWIIILGMVISPMLLCSQSSQSVKNFFKKYQNNDEAEQFKIGGLVLDLAISFSDDEESKNILKKLKRLRLLSFEDINPVDPSDFRQLMKGIQADRYSPLIKLRQKGETVDIFVQEKNNYISEVLLIVQSQEEFILLNLEGKFRFEDLNDFDLDTKGGDHLRRLPEKRSELPKA